MRLIDQLNSINIGMNKFFEDLVSYPFLRRGNYQFKISVYKKNNVLVVARHIIHEEKFIVKHFSSPEEAAIYIEYIVEKDFYG